MPPKTKTATCMEHHETAALFYRTLLATAGTRRLLEALPLKPIREYTWRGNVRAKIKSMTRGIDAGLFDQTWNAMEWPWYRVLSRQPDDRIIVRGLGGTWEIAAEQGGPQLEAYDRRELLRLRTSPSPAREDDAPRDAHQPGRPAQLSAAAALEMLHAEAARRGDPPPTPRAQPVPDTGRGPKFSRHNPQLPPFAAPPVPPARPRTPEPAHRPDWQRPPDQPNRTQAAPPPCQAPGCPWPRRPDGYGGYFDYCSKTCAGQAAPPPTCARFGCPKSRWEQQPYCSRDCKDADPAPGPAPQPQPQPGRQHGPAPTTGAPPPQRRTLLPSDTADTCSNLLSAILTALHLPPDDTVLRPHLVACVRAHGYDTKYPFQELVGEPMGLPLADFMDENCSTSATKSIEQTKLQASVRAEETNLTVKDGTMSVLAGSRPKLPEIPTVATLKTPAQCIYAIRNLSAFYQATGHTARARLMDTHANSMRQLNNDKMLSDAHFIDFEHHLRQLRVRIPGNDTWELDRSTTGKEGALLMQALQSSWGAAANSTRPGKDQSAANTGKRTCPEWKQGKPCPRGADCPHSHRARDKGRSEKTKGGAKGGAQANPGTAGRRVPQAWLDAHPCSGICVQFAYFGNCTRAAGDSCTSNAGKQRKHVCALCNFANGKHAITEGAGPNGKC